MLHVRAVSAAALAVVLAGPALADRTFETDKVTLRVETVAKGLVHPWGLALLPDGRFLVTERNPGRLRLGDRDGKLSEPLGNVPEVFRYEGPTDRSQAGLFHVALHPDFESNRLVYLSFSEPSDEGAGTAIARGRLVDEGTPRLEDVEVIYTQNKHDSSGLHFGGRFAFDPKDKSIVLSVGERRNISRAQDGEDHAGSFIRITDDGGVPNDNPFRNAGDKDEKVFAIGNRNSQGLAFDPETGRLWANDHGPKGGDEINLIEAGKNYGWPFQTGGVDYSGAPMGKGSRGVEGMEDPVHIWEETVAPSGLVVYRGEMFPEWRGDLLHGGLAARGVVRTKIEDGKVTEDERMLTDFGRRIRDVQVDREGALWLITEHEDGEVLRVTRAEPAATGAVERKQ
ncbi:MAG TPA: PQQ-dependent sugar dehydrogenase [Beijerinckiaceae bacterium]|nr:PQQ-dependent sugar dehydrogenase [Beijerinckiaceae bacterium]